MFEEILKRSSSKVSSSYKGRLAPSKLSTLSLMSLLFVVTTCLSGAVQARSSRVLNND